MQQEPGLSCLVCHSALRFFGPKDGYRYYLCADCGSLQLNPLPTEEELESLYRKKYLEENLTEKTFTPEEWQETSENYQRSVLSMVAKHRVRGPLLDFGAGYGFLVRALQEQGVESLGFELSEPKLEYCRKNSIPVQMGGMNELSAMKDKINGVVMIAVFEHLSAHRDFLTRLNEVLPDGGVFVSLHPTAMTYRILGNWARLGNKKKELPFLSGAFAPPWHVAFLSLDGMRRLAEETGFTVEDVQPAPQGRLSGPLGLVQAGLELVNKVGWSLMGESWPSVTSHVFLLRKKSRPGTSRQPEPMHA